MPEKCPNCKEGYNSSAGGTMRCNTCDGSGTVLSRDDLVQQIEVQNELLLKVYNKHKSMMWSDMIRNIEVCLSESGDIIIQESKRARAERNKKEKA